MRLPWTRAEDEFLEACTRCSACIAACPTSIVTAGHGGYPIVAFAGIGCTFCGACADACERDCFTADRTGSAWPLKARIANSCVETKGVACRMCEDTCEALAIRFRPQSGGRALAQIDDARCTGCGACLPACPIKAIAVCNPAHVEALT